MQSRGFGAFLLTILYPATTASSEAMFLNLRMLYESRERNSKIYSANAFITAMIICEIPYSILGSVFFFLPWFYMIGFPNSSANAGYMFFLVTLFQIFMPPFGMLIASFVPDMTTASIGMFNPPLYKGQPEIALLTHMIYHSQSVHLCCHKWLHRNSCAL